MKNTLHDDDLIAMYRAGRATFDGLDGDTLVAYAAGNLSSEQHSSVASSLAGSPAATALVAMLAELQSDSDALAAAASRRQVAGHALGRREQRRSAATAPRRRRAPRWMASLAACALAVVAVFAFNAARQPAGHDADVVSESAAHSDRIFSMRDDRIFNWTLESAGQPASAADDRMFRSSFNKGG